MAKSYSIVCKGIYCQSESDHDQGSNSDEPYVVVSVVAKNGSGPKDWATKTVRVPGTGGAFSDVDDNETRHTEVICWDGPGSIFQIGAQMFEQDGGDPEQTRKQIANFVKAAAEAGEFGTGFTVPDELTDELPFLIGALFGLGDDEIDSYQSRVFTEAQLASLAAKAPKSEHGMKYRFRTFHSGGGAFIKTYYDVLTN